MKKIGKAFQTAYGATLTAGQEALKAATNAAIQGGLASMRDPDGEKAGLWHI